MIARPARVTRALVIGLALLCSVAAGFSRAALARQAGEPEGISLLGRALRALPPGPETEPLEQALRSARARLVEHTGDPDVIIWVGRRLGYLWRMNEAIDTYTEGLKQHPDHPELLRHRGHRYISLRQFDDAIEDLQRAAELIEGKPDVVEQDGMPNEAGIPLTTTGFNVWYHLALARYLKGDVAGAAAAWRRTLDDFTGGHDDNVVAVTDWLYLALRRMGRHDEAARLLDPIRADMKILENHAYHRRLMMYKGSIPPETLLEGDDAEALDLATLGYGLGRWYGYNGKTDRAREIFRQVVDRGPWPAFGTIAAEAALARPGNNEGEKTK